MDIHARPYLGSTQPDTGSNLTVPSVPMGRRSKQHRPPAIIQQFFADNVKLLRDSVFADFEHETGRNRALARGADTTLSQIQRIIKQDVAPGIDMLEKIARVLKVTPADLVTPYFAQRLLPPPPADSPPFRPDSPPRPHPESPNPPRRSTY